MESAVHLVRRASRLNCGQEGLQNDHLPASTLIKYVFIQMILFHPNQIPHHCISFFDASPSKLFSVSSVSGRFLPSSLATFSSAFACLAFSLRSTFSFCARRHFMPYRILAMGPKLPMKKMPARIVYAHLQTSYVSQFMVTIPPVPNIYQFPNSPIPYGTNHGFNSCTRSRAEQTSDKIIRRRRRRRSTGVDVDDQNAHGLSTDDQAIAQQEQHDDGSGQG